MPIFEYKALDKSGNQKAGMVDADTARDARLQLRKENLFVTDIQQTNTGAKKSDGKSSKFNLSIGRKVSSHDITIVTRQLATLLKAGIPIVAALRALIEQVENKQIEIILRDIHEKITQGINLADAMRAHPAMFNNLYVSMIRAGEATGQMDTVLDRLSVYIQKQTRLQNKVKGALIYPVILVVVAVAVVFVLMKFVVPKITNLVTSTGKVLPWNTKLLISASKFIGSWWWLMGLAVIVICILYRVIHATKKGGLAIDTFKLKMWIFGPLLSKTAISRFAITLSILLRSGISALPALLIVKDIVGNLKMAEVIQLIHDKLIEGTDITTPLKKSGVFPPTVAYMISVGEKSGQLEEILETLAESYEEEVEFAAQRMVALLEPVMIIVMALVVGFIALSIIMPIMQLKPGR